MERIHLEITDILQIEGTVHREELVAERAYDGRLRNKVFVDRRKEKSRRHCRNHGRENDE